MIACPEEIAFHLGLIDVKQLTKLAEPLAKNWYGQYLLALVSDLGSPRRDVDEHR